MEPEAFEGLGNSERSKHVQGYDTEGAKTPS